jgi:hypothetical protein
MIERLQQKNECSPDQGEKVMRPDNGEDKKEETSGYKRKIPPG